MNNHDHDHVKNFEQRLVSLFERKAEEFTRYSQEEPKTASVTAELAGLYQDLVQVMRA